MTHRLYCALFLGIELLDPYILTGFVLNVRGYYVDRLDGFMVGSSQTEQSKFTFAKIDDYRIKLISDNGENVTRVTENNVDYIKATTTSPEESAIFRVYNNNGQLHIKADNGKYVTLNGNNFKAVNIVNNIYSIFTVEAPNVKSGMNKSDS